jgi:DNA-binding transcriptional LysR family regulator
MSVGHIGFGDHLNLTAGTIRQRLLARARLRHWLGFARVAELGSVRKAAEAIGLAQPALSALLADLEALVGAPLFDRHARGMRLTGLGRELLPTARRLLRAVDEAAEQAAALQAQARHVVRVGAIGGAISGLLTQALPVLAQRHPTLLVQLLEADAQQLDQWVAQGEVDLALCRAPRVVPDGWVYEPLREDRFVVVAGAGHPLADRTRVNLARLARERWLALPCGSAARAALDALFAELAVTPDLCLVSSRVPAVLWAMLKTQPLLALVPASVARQLVEAGELVELRIERTLPFEAIGALRPDVTPGEAVAALLQVLRSVPP